MEAPGEIIRLRLRVRGLVQGVGFRPFVHGLAARLGVSGFVGNEAGGVFLEVEAAALVLDRFRAVLRSDAPPLAVIEQVEAEPIPPLGEVGFVIVPSRDATPSNITVPPDTAVCADCLREMFDPADRRFRYPFINCTNCGPRFTLILDMPYDRPRTTMRSFALCPACEREYHDPTDRRFHAQPIACPVCGPQVWFRDRTGGEEVPDEAAIQAAREALKAGRVVAVKGIGGFHLACDATNDVAVSVLRQRKGRGQKPLAVMMSDAAEVRRYAILDESEERILAGRERPIVLLRMRESPGGLSHHVAPGQMHVGVMLPYSPLHHLLIEEMPPLVMTSGNRSDEPIVKENDEALDRLAGLADAFLLHDRVVHAWCDDSVVRVFRGVELPVRRSRGYAPYPVRLPFDLPPTLAVGGEVKATFALASGRHAYLSQHIGDMENLETLTAFERAADHFEALFRIEPRRVVCDLHPGYLSSRWAEQYAAQRGLELVKVQHHHAHVATVLAEHGWPAGSPVIGVAFDGTGYGTDRTVWGGEFLIAGYAGFHRAAHLQPVPLPGGDAGVKHVSRLGMAYLHAAGIPWSEAIPCVAACAGSARSVLARQLASGFNCVPITSMGRLFDAVAAILGVCQTATYEAQAAMELEAACSPDLAVGEAGYRFALTGDDPIVCDFSPVLWALVADWGRGVPVGVLAARFHDAVAALVGTVASTVRQRTGVSTVALSGGVFQNVALLERTVDRLEAEGFAVLVHRRVPPNDGGLALGQLVVGCGANSG